MSIGYFQNIHAITATIFTINHNSFTILAIKTYLKTTYREIIEILEVSNKITNYLKLNKLPHYTTIQKFFLRMSDTKLKELNKLILLMHPIDCQLAAMDGKNRTLWDCQFVSSCFRFSIQPSFWCIIWLNIPFNVLNFFLCALGIVFPM
ncbi:hypothetical protein MBORA_10200 [Methanobrevibacter oralis]|uniref:Uncharacterized protein n=1 Tax=Methanobrevibacter oralis TaxID=66851 RepID=A0A166B4D7_METOA|nr:hypothetical protein MBORA_10200 [Methanobrevibacter oralis]